MLSDVSRRWIDAGVMRVKLSLIVLAILALGACTTVDATVSATTSGCGDGRTLLIRAKAGGLGSVESHMTRMSEDVCPMGYDRIDQHTQDEDVVWVIRCRATTDQARDSSQAHC
jgi:hypothetical protein